MRTKINSPKAQYLKELFCDEDANFELAKSNANKLNPDMSISFIEGKILQVLLRSIHAKKVIEVGTFTGYSALWIAKALNNEGKVWTLEQNPEHAKLAKEALSDSPVCEVLEGNALDSLKLLEKEAPFDAIFIDADKSGYLDYLDWASQHIRKGGLIIGDNTYLFENVYLDSPTNDISKKAWEVMRKFNKALSNPDKYTSVILPTEEGMSISIKEF